MADLLTKEHYDLMAQFEREHSGRFDKEDKALWLKGIIYQDGRLNELFLAYRRGYAFCEADMRSDIQNLEASRDGYRADAERLAAALAQQDADKVNGALAEMVHAMFRSSNSIPVTRITIDRKQYEAAIDAARKEQA